MKPGDWVRHAGVLAVVQAVTKDGVQVTGHSGLIPLHQVEPLVRAGSSVEQDMDSAGTRQEAHE